MAGKIEQVVAFTGSMPTGVTVSKDKRIFVNFPRWGQPDYHDGKDLREKPDSLFRVKIDRVPVALR